MVARKIMSKGAGSVTPAEPRRDELRRHRVEIGHDIALDPRIERPVPVEGQVQFVARIGHQSEAQERSAPAVAVLVPGELVLRGDGDGMGRVEIRRAALGALILRIGLVGAGAGPFIG